MTLEQLIKPESVLCNAHARSKKHSLEILSELLSRTNPDIPTEEIFSRLVERERLGCTGLEKGTAFPHCRIEGLEQSTGALMRLSKAVDFDSADGELVDLVIGLIVPANLDDSHYADIELVTAALSDHALRDRLRDATTSNDLYQALISGTQPVDETLKNAQAG
jgi:PTS system nitrogen regulatory IIA component